MPSLRILPARRWPLNWHKPISCQSQHASRDSIYIVDLAFSGVFSRHFLPFLRIWRVSGRFFPFSYDCLVFLFLLICFIPLFGAVRHHVSLTITYCTPFNRLIYSTGQNSSMTVRSTTHRFITLYLSSFIRIYGHLL